MAKPVISGPSEPDTENPSASQVKLAARSSERYGLVRPVPLLADKKMLNGEPTAYVCRNYACQEPTSDAARLRDQLAQEA